jgi:multidrug efflux pump subunit AcrB
MSRKSRAIQPGAKRSAVFRATQWFFDQLLRAYDWSLRGVLKHRFIMATVFVGVLGGRVGYAFDRVR